MSAAKTGPGIYNIPAGIAFSRALAAQLIAETKTDPESLAAYRLILPTRRAGRVLRDAFLQLTDGKPLLLPQMHALGDIDEEELSLSIAGQDASDNLLEIAPSLPPLKRQILLASTIMAIPDYAKSFDQALLLAAALGRLMDQVYTEGLDLKDLVKIVPEDFSSHWQITLEFMKILSEAWPAILAEMGMIDAADRRNKLLRELARHWRQTPPQGPVIAAGTTGSIPATRELLHVISQLPLGRIVLPGLDQDMDQASWEALEESHPQYNLRELLHEMEADREQVALWPGIKPETARPRRILAAEIMRPSQTTGSWTSDLPINKPAQQSIQAATQDLHIIAAANEREEAAAIAVLLREALETPSRTAALITPRRSLARRISAACRRWGIVLDDSGGQTLGQTPVGSFLRLSAQAAADDFTPVSLLALLKNSFCKAENIEMLDFELRGPRPAPGLKGIKDRDQDKIMRVTGPILERFMNGSGPEKPRKYGEILKAHLELIENLAANPQTLWQRPDGEAASAFLAELQDHSGLFPDMGMQSYAAILDSLLKTVTVRPPYGTHPRLHILGQLEARMIDSDLIIMAGLNEKTWPPDPGHDPWMSRPMRSEFGLPSPERQIGLAAHDFVQGFCVPAVVLTRALRQDGAPTVPARWLQRLSAVLEAAGIDESQILNNAAISWARGLDEAAAITPLKRPEPRPPLAARPRKISVTQVEKWQQDPYSLYAKYVLKLKKIDALEKPVDAAEKGDLLHEILKHFVRVHPAAIPADAELILTQIAAAELDKRHDDPAVWSFWQRRFEKTANWLAAHEREWRETATPAGTETKGTITIETKAGPFTLEGRADRIDAIPDGGAVIDYKSGGDFTKTALKDGRLPQLPLEGLILASGKFENVPALKPASLQYWKLTGGTKPGEIVIADANIEALVAKTEAGLKMLVEAFASEETPYYSLPRPDNAPRFNDYKHLARVNEWAALGDDDSGSEAA